MAKSQRVQNGRKKNKKEFEGIIKSIEDGSFKGPTSNEILETKGYDKIIESFLSNMQNDIKENTEKAFRKPLKEKYSILKYRLDMLSIKLRIHVFIVAIVSLCFAIILKLIV